MEIELKYVQYLNKISKEYHLELDKLEKKYGSIQKKSLISILLNN